MNDQEIKIAEWEAYREKPFRDLNLAVKEFGVSVMEAAYPIRKMVAFIDEMYENNPEIELLEVRRLKLNRRKRMVVFCARLFAWLMCAIVVWTILK